MSITVNSSLVTVDGVIVGLLLPDVADVRMGTTYGPTGADYTGALVVGGAYPTPAEISTAVLTALNATTIPVDLQKVRGQSLTGVGTSADPWGPV